MGIFKGEGESRSTLKTGPKAEEFFTTEAQRHGDEEVVAFFLI
jgi:hypothetical protein